MSDDAAAPRRRPTGEGTGQGGGAKHGADDGSGIRSFKTFIRSAVEATNRFLAAAQGASDAVRAPLVKGLDAVESGGSAVAATALHAYERRHEFGPHLVAGSAAAAGGAVALRRGRLPGVLVGVLAGGLAYLAVYETVPLREVPDYLFGKKDGE